MPLNLPRSRPDPRKAILTIPILQFTNPAVSDPAVSLGKTMLLPSWPAPTGRAQMRLLTAPKESKGLPPLRVSLSLGQPNRQLLPQAAQRLTHLRLDGFYGDPECIGDFGITKAVYAAEFKHFAAALGKCGDGVTQSSVDFPVCEVLLSGGGYGGFALEERGGTCDDALVADVVQCTIARGSEEVGAQRTLDHQCFAAAPHFEQDVLNDLLGVGALVKQRLGACDQRCIMDAEYGFEDGLVALCEALENFTVAHPASLPHERGGRRERRDGSMCTATFSQLECHEP